MSYCSYVHLNSGNQTVLQQWIRCTVNCPITNQDSARFKLHSVSFCGKSSYTVLPGDTVDIRIPSLQMEYLTFTGKVIQKDNELFLSCFNEPD